MDSKWYDELLSKVDMVGLVSRYVHLTRKGNSHWGCCPFHHEKTPSFKVDETTKLFYCFGCKECGNAINFLSKIESIERIDAVKMLAESVHMQLPEYDSDKAKKERMDSKYRARLYDLMREAARHYHDNLSDPRAAVANRYLDTRQIGDNLVKRFGLGYSINGSEMVDYLNAKGFTHREMKDAGLIDQRADKYYDVFYGRLIIPIINAFGEVVAFGGRVLEAKPDFAKYRNSTQTVIFDKSKTIYGVNLLKRKKQREQIPYVIMVEGYMDAISLHKAGFDTAVASMGTSLTYDQARLIRNYCNKVYISYDGDGAGQKATLRGLDILVGAGLDVKVVKLPNGLDPDDVIKQYGRETYSNLLEKAVTLPAFKIDKLSEQFDLTTPDGKSKFAVQAINVIKKLENPVEQEEYLGKLRDMTGYTMNVLLKQAELVDVIKDKESEHRATQTSDIATVGAIDKAEEFVLASMLDGKDYVDYDEDVFPYLTNEFTREVYSQIINNYRIGISSPSSLYNTVDPKFRSRLGELINYQFMAGDDRAKFDSCLYLLRIRYFEAEKQRLADEYDLTKNPKFIGEIRRLQVQINQMKKSGGV